MNFFWNLKEWWASEKKEKNPPQCFVWFSTGLGSSQNSQNNLIHNWCTGECWVTASWKEEDHFIFSCSSCICGWGFPSNPFLCWITELPGIKPCQFIFTNKSSGTLWCWIELSLTKIVQFSNNTLGTVGLDIMKPPQCTPLYSTQTTHWGIFQCYPEHDKKRLDDSRRSYCDKQNKTKQNKQPSFQR